MIDRISYCFKVVKDKGIVVKFHTLKAVVHAAHLSKPLDKYVHGEQVWFCFSWIS